jgi:ferritin-like metal-binding protein YciE
LFEGIFMEIKEHLLDWLRDAHAMELKAVEMLEKQADRIEGYPDIQRQLSQHAKESQIQATRIKDCINRLDSTHSTAKDIMGKAMGTMAAITSSMASDEIVKNAIANFAFENFEIACYRSLIDAAGLAGEYDIVEACKENLREEEDMAAWLSNHIPILTREFLERDLVGAEAKK